MANRRLPCPARKGEWSETRAAAGTCKGTQLDLRKIHEQIDAAIRLYDKLVLVLSPHSLEN